MNNAKALHLSLYASYRLQPIGICQVTFQVEGTPDETWSSIEKEVMAYYASTGYGFRRNNNEKVSILHYAC